ncbi:MAG: bifunctional UDP-N-acetylglucosamine diphosphorylase/glucosamine-1-phosphate N-acetyltransferase GlmU [Turicibacter sp.]|nr:bifunctional UDP-N-acetylglucosamine diphosphorylase/glucosamine-1-phosphate N-acetyltransferase GlmU [Turicibacter sp.]
MKRYGIVLGAGMGTRMKSEVPKVLHEVMGKAMIEHVIGALETAGSQELIVVTGHKSELVEARLGDRAVYAKQEEQLGTAHAVQMADGALAGKPGMTMVTYGDDPLLTSETLELLFTKHENSGAKMTMLTNVVANPFGLGRIIRDASGEVARIVEQKDATPEELKTTEINTGIACYDNEVLFEALKLVGNDNAQGEYYLTDLVEIIKGMGHAVESVVIENVDGVLGVNDRVQLANNGRIMRERINKKHMENGVTLIDPLTTYIEADVVIGSDVVIEPNVYLKGNTVVEAGAFIGAGSDFENAKIGSGAQILASFVVDSEVGAHATVGPFAHLRAGAVVGAKSRIGNFVEIKKATLGEGVKAAHLAYMGDAEIGPRVNMSCGAIIANYDGKKKHKTVIGADAMIGSNVNLIAPVEIGEGAYVAAGSTVSKNVPAEALAIARAKQENKEGYAKRL